VSADTAVNVVAVIVAALIGVLGSIWGARKGAEATRDATQFAMDAERANERVRHEQTARDSLRALAVECRANSYFLDRLERFSAAHPGIFASSRLERTAFDADLAALPSLPEELRKRAMVVRFYVARINGLLDLRAAVEERSGWLREVEQEIEHVRRSVTEEDLDGFATAILRWADGEEQRG
jgi:hypothetical protein